MQNRKQLVLMLVVIAAAIGAVTVIISVNSRSGSRSQMQGASPEHTDLDIHANEELGIGSGNGRQAHSPNTQDTSVASAFPGQADRESKIDSGFVFVNGKYISAPYKVSVQKGWLHVNGVRIRRLCEWPIRVAPREKAKPKIPQRVLDNARSFEDLRIQGGGSWHGRMGRWITKTSASEDERMKRAIQFYTSLPFVESVTRIKPHIFEVVLSDGQKMKFGFSGVAGMDTSPPTKEEILNNLKHEMTRLEERLHEGWVIFYFGSLKMSFGERKVARDLGVMVHILASDRTDEEKLDLLHRMDIIPIDQDENIQPYLGSFRATDQLKQRIAELEARTDIEPRSLDDIPDVSPAEREMRLLEAAAGQSED